MKKTNIPLLAFLAWMAALLCICAITNRSLAQQLVTTDGRVVFDYDACNPDFPEALKTRPESETIAYAVNLAKAIVSNNVQNVTVDSPTAHLTTRKQLEHSTFALKYATCLLETFTYMTDVEVEIAMGVAGYDRAMDWALTSNNFGKIALPAPLID